MRERVVRCRAAAPHGMERASHIDAGGFPSQAVVAHVCGRYLQGQSEHPACSDETVPGGMQLFASDKTVQALYLGDL